MRNIIEITENIFPGMMFLVQSITSVQKQREMGEGKERGACDSVFQYFIRSEYYSDSVLAK